MNYGLPYQGSKNRIAKRLVEALPAALDELEPIFREIHIQESAENEAMVLSLMKQFKNIMQSEMFV